MPTKSKKSFLERIAKQLGIKIKVEILSTIDNDETWKRTEREIRQINELHPCQEQTAKVEFWYKGISADGGLSVGGDIVSDGMGKVEGITIYLTS